MWCVWHRSLTAMIGWAKHLLVAHQHKSDFRVDELLEVMRTKVRKNALAV